VENLASPSHEQLTLIQGGEFIVCDNITFTPEPPALFATTAQPINTMKPVSLRLENEIIPLHTLVSQVRKVQTTKVRIDGEMALRTAKALGLLKPPADL